MSTYFPLNFPIFPCFGAVITDWNTVVVLLHHSSVSSGTVPSTQRIICFLVYACHTSFPSGHLGEEWEILIRISGKMGYLSPFKQMRPNPGTTKRSEHILAPFTLPDFHPGYHLRRDRIHMKEKAGQPGSCPPNFGYLLNACFVPIPLPDAGTVMESQSLASLWGDLL